MPGACCCSLGSLVSGNSTRRPGSQAQGRETVRPGETAHLLVHSPNVCSSCLGLGPSQSQESGIPSGAPIRVVETQPSVTAAKTEAHAVLEAAVQPPAGVIPQSSFPPIPCGTH